MKKFFQEIKADIKFKSAGPGQKLTDSAGCVTRAGRRGWQGPGSGKGWRGAWDTGQAMLSGSRWEGGEVGVAEVAGRGRGLRGGRGAV